MTAQTTSLFGASQLLLIVSINNTIMVIFIYNILIISQIHICALTFFKLFTRIIHLLSKNVITLHILFMYFHEADMLELSRPDALKIWQLNKPQKILSLCHFNLNLVVKLNILYVYKYLVSSLNYLFHLFLLLMFILGIN